MRVRGGRGTVLGGALRTAGRVAGAGFALSARTAEAAVHIGTAPVRALVPPPTAPPAPTVPEPAAAGRSTSLAGRQVWSARGRAQIEVFGLTKQAGDEVATAVERAVDDLPGVAWARIDRVTGRLVTRFDDRRVTVPVIVGAVADAERSVGAEKQRTAGPGSPADSRPVRLEAISLVADVVGLSAAVAGRLARLPALPASVGAAVVLVDYQPRLRKIVEDRLGKPGADLALTVSSAAVHGLTQGVVSVAVDTASRWQSYTAVRARQTAFSLREAELHGPRRPVAETAVEVGERPVPVPPGPVERFADRAATGSLMAAGALAAIASTRLSGVSPWSLAGQAVLVGVPKASRTARESFCESLLAGLARNGTIVVDELALRRLDRVSTVLVESTVLLGERPLILDARVLPRAGATGSRGAADGWTREQVWSAAQRLLDDQRQLPIPPPAGRRRERLDLTEVRTDGSTRIVRLEEDGRAVGELTIAQELHPWADALLAAARAGGARLVLTDLASARDLYARADEVLDAGVGAAAEGAVRAIRQWQRDGQVVAVVGQNERALAAADLGIGIVPPAGRVPWAAHVVTGPGLSDAIRLLAAMPVARAVSQRGVTLAGGASFLGGLLAAVGSGRRGGATLPVNLAALSGIWGGSRSARDVVRRADPPRVLHTPWHALEPDEVVHRLAEIDAAAERDAPAADQPADPGRFDRVFRLVSVVRAELSDPLTPVLATGAAASAVIGSATDAILVGSVLGANAVVSGLQRLRAENALRELLLDQRLTARRLPMRLDPEYGPRLPAQLPESSVVPADRLRVGDLIELRPGDVVPADARLIREDGLEVDEASLTGESVAIGKQVQATPGAELADRACMVYEGTTVLAGEGVAVVVAVGADNEGGRAIALAGRAGGPAGMQARLEELTRRGLPVTLLGGAAVTALGLLRGQSIRAAIGSGVSVAVAAVPEGLPLVATVAQLSAARRLSQRGVLVRSARTIEALGRLDTVCFDKTGTLTRGELTLARVAGLDTDWDVADPAATRVLRAAAKACPRPEPGEPMPHATDRAVLEGARAALGEGELKRDWAELAELPFQSERGYSAAVGRIGGGKLRLVVKGAPEVLLPRCTHVRDDAGKRPLDDDLHEQAERMVRTLARQGLRVLAVARRSVPADHPGADDLQDEPEEFTEHLTEDLTLLGFVGLTDVPRPQAARTIRELGDAGLATVMITGDHPITARAIAAELGIPSDVVVTGPQLAGLDERRRIGTVAGSSVFARVSPEQKLQIVAALQSAGRTVAMTGDGTNDAAAIRLADVGIGMTAHGSTAARSAADLVLTEPDVSLMVPALVEGRAMWRRVRDAIAILLGGNAGEVTFTLAGTAIAGRAPINTRQFLLVNMLTDLLPAMAIALAATPQELDVRREILRAGAPSLGAPLLRDIGIRGGATALGALAAWRIGALTGLPVVQRRRADTMALAALVATQLGQTLVIGARNPLVVVTGVGSTLALAAIIQTPGVSQFFGCTPLGPVAWTITAASAAGATGLAVLAPHLLPAVVTRPDPSDDSTD